MSLVLKLSDEQVDVLRSVLFQAIDLTGLDYRSGLIEYPNMTLEYFSNWKPLVSILNILIIYQLEVCEDGSRKEKESEEA